MAAGPIKFRCSQCRQLLGVARSKAGTLVACPKCATDLLVPFEDEPAPAPAPTPSPSPAAPSTRVATDAPGFGRPEGPDRGASGSIEDVDADSGLSLDLLNIRPEDIRVVAGHPSSAIPPPPPLAPVAPPVLAEEGPPPALTIEPDEDDVDTTEIPLVPERPTPTRPSVATVVARPKPAVPDPKGSEEPVTPPIRLDEPFRPSRGPQPVALRARDLILPRSVVASWSALVLLAVGFAFVAGVLVGHYIWREH